MKKILLLTSLIFASCYTYANENTSSNFNQLDTYSIKEDLALEIQKVNKELNDQVINDIKQNKIKIKNDLIASKKKENRNLLNNI